MSFDPTNLPDLNLNSGTGAAWDQLPGEPDQAFVAFQLFLESEPAIDAELAARVGVPLRELRATAMAWHWPKRRIAFEIASRALRREVLAKELRVKDEEILAIMDRWIKYADESFQDAMARGEKLSPADVRAFTKQATETRQLLTGQPTARQHIDLSQATPEQRAAYRALVDNDDAWVDGN